MTPTWALASAAPGMPSRQALIPRATAATAPDAHAAAETSITNRYEGGMGARTMYSAGATYSTEPCDSSGLDPGGSILFPSASSGA